MVSLKKVTKSGESLMATQTVKNLTGATVKTSKPPYPFRTGWALLLLGINFVVAAYYFGVLK